jgi:Fe-S-cluster-containing dehydrogenase component
MAIHIMQVDVGRCVACFACEVACEQENHLRTGISWVRISKICQISSDSTVRVEFAVRLCRHCDNPPCADVCPTQAIAKRSDGIVLLESELCTGCRLCLEACPFGAIEVDPEKQIAQKCTMCMHRIEKGLEPSCFLHCPARAISFTTEGI